MRANFFTVTVNGQPVEAAHAAASYEFVSFDTKGPAQVAITADQAGFWDGGVDIEPWRLGLRAVRDGQTIRFKIPGPVKLSISRPHDFLNHAAMLFLFAGTPPPAAPDGPMVHIVSAGVHRQSINPQSGDTWYFEPGAYVFGSINLWNVENVKILGRGTIVYDGPQDPNNDEGWMQKPDWHCIGALNAKNVEIQGLTCVIRSRTWSIQMKDSTGFLYDDLRVMGGNQGNANQDGMDWLSSGNTIVRNSFLRASDDVFAMLGNWDGYTEEALKLPGKDVDNILIEHSQLSTSISNIVRVGWPQKVFNSSSFTLRDSDILHGGIGACGQTFAVLGMWGANDARGSHSELTFENLFLDNWYSLTQIEQELPSVRDLTFRNIWALDQPPLAESTLQGNVSGVTFANVKYGRTTATSNADLPLVVSDGAEQPKYEPANSPIAAFAVSPPFFGAGTSVRLSAVPGSGLKYKWLFGDGTEGSGSCVTHKFADALGTDLDGKNGAGRFRVLLQVVDKKGNQDWSTEGVVVVDHWQDARMPGGSALPGLDYRIYPGAWPELPDLSTQSAVFAGQTANLQASAEGFTRYATAWDGFLDIPADGGYTFHLMDRDGARLVIDGKEVAKTGPPFAQVCGSPGNAVRYDRGSLGLRAGLHAFHLEALNNASMDSPRVLWEGPGLRLTDVPPQAFSRLRMDEVRR